MAGGWQTDVRRVGNVVTREAKPQSRTVMALLHHLHDRGFDGSPQPIDDGFTTDGREQLEYIDGETPHPGPWTDEDAWRLGDLVRRLHDATATFVPPTDAIWRPWFARALRGERRVIGRPRPVGTRPSGVRTEGPRARTCRSAVGRSTHHACCTGTTRTPSTRVRPLPRRSPCLLRRGY